jgi:hypothetical protein
MSINKRVTGIRTLLTLIRTLLTQERWGLQWREQLLNTLPFAVDWSSS